MTVGIVGATAAGMLFAIIFISEGDRNERERLAC